VSIGTQVLSQQPGFLDLKALESADTIHSRHSTEAAMQDLTFILSINY